MTDGGGAVLAASAAQQITANAIKASGAVVRLEPGDFQAIIGKSESPLVVCAQGGVFTTKYRYLSPYRGLVFFTETRMPLSLPSRTEVIVARKIWTPE